MDDIRANMTFSFETLSHAEWYDRETTAWSDQAIASISIPRFINATQKEPYLDTPYVLHVLCEACTKISKIVEDRLDRIGIREGYQSWGHIDLKCTMQDLHISANLGCHFCALLEASNLSHMRQGRPDPFSKNPVNAGCLYLLISPPADELVLCTLRLYNITLGSAQYGNPLHISKFSDHMKHSQNFPTTIPSLQRNTGDETTFEIVSQWVQTCLQEHVKCKGIEPSKPNIPRRLLSIGDTHVEVIENSSHEYVCLSHCWGKSQPPQQLRSNHYGPFKISSLPRSFGDAIQITRKLGFKYIWIDCFCIIQDDTDDWLDQSSAMSEIYANSALTIAALTAHDSHGGCFVNRNPLSLHPLHHGSLAITIRSWSHLTDLELGNFNYNSSPLLTRAWVVQERYSSPRTLFYGALGIYWECRQVRASENSYQLENEVHDYIKGMLTQLIETAQNREPKPGIQTPFLGIWRGLLSVYTQGLLTKPTDKLVALMGIIHNIERRSQKHCIQGLWEEDFTSELLWNFNFRIESPRSNLFGSNLDNGLPSWTWASRMGPISYNILPGLIEWSTPFSVSPDQNQLHIMSWKRMVTVTESGELTLVNDGTGKGDFQEEYVWYPDDTMPPDFDIWIVLIQRVIITPQPFLGCVNCLVVRQVEHEFFERIGTTVIRFQQKKHDPFPDHEKNIGGEIVLV